MSLESRAMQMKVIGKSDRIKGFIFKRPEYLVAFQIVDEGVTPHITMEREVPFNQYSAVNIGDEVNIRMYTPNGHTWYFSREEAGC